MTDVARLDGDQASAGLGGENQNDDIGPLPGSDDDFGLTPRPAKTRRRPDPLIGRDLGGFVIEKLIGEGGMGRVYRARQLRPERTVALKIVRPGLAAERAEKRFESEASFLAKLQHPGIALVFLVGSYPSDFGELPYFVMEYVVDARPITQFAGERGLGLPDKLNLFAEVCDAVAHGHARGVVHRDLKPSNVLVDGDGQPKVIDFGVARSIESDRAATRQTSVALVGTVQYMAPEQFLGSGHSRPIDSRADVYSLGVLLYELVAGAPPCDLQHQTIQDMMRLVCEEEPPPLRSRDRSCPRDVSLIAERCLAKTPGERYRDAGELAADVRRFLAGESLLHARPDLLARLRRTIGRYRRWAVPALVGATLASLALALAGRGRPREVLVDAFGRPVAPLPEEPASPEGKFFHRIAKAARAKTLDQTEIVGKVGFGYQFSDLPMNGGYLVGVRVSTGKFGAGLKYEAVGSIQPVYKTPDGELQGEMHGPIGGYVTDFIAKDGYAVSGLVLNAPNRLHGFQVIFSRVVGDRLDLEDSYRSEPYLDLPQGSPTIGQTGQLAVGLRGWWARDEVRGIGLYMLP